MDVEIDEATLRNIADRTGGKYFRATDERKLKDIYNEIDRLEKTRIKVTEHRAMNEEYFPFAVLGLRVVGYWASCWTAVSCITWHEDERHISLGYGRSRRIACGGHRIDLAVFSRYGGSWTARCQRSNGAIRRSCGRCSQARYFAFFSSWTWPGGTGP